MATIEEIVSRAAQMGASDIHLAPARPARFRIDGSLADAQEFGVFDADDTESIAREVTQDACALTEGPGEFDMAGTYAGVRCRLNLYRASNGLCLAIRLLAQNIPALSGLGLPPAVLELPLLNKGIVLVTGETGSGKSTTLAALINEINRTRAQHIITLEDPIEYIYEPAQCSIDQREIGRDTESYAHALRAVLREDPDIILIGEMRDLETIETALTAAETGHLVFATLHTQSAADSIDRLVDVFPEGRQRQIRLQLSTTLQAVVSQQLLVRASGVGRVLACEVMVVNPAIRNLIREGKTPQIENTIATTADLGSVTMDNALIHMVRTGDITAQSAVDAAHDRQYVRSHVR